MFGIHLWSFVAGFIAAAVVAAGVVRWMVGLGFEDRDDGLP